MPWQDSYDTHIWIFGVGRGMAAFVRTGLNHGFIIDMACSDEFDPAAFVKDNFSKKLETYRDARIAQALLSHPHRDHIQQCDKISDGQPLRPCLLTCPNDKEEGAEFDWDRIGDDREGASELIATYRSLFKQRTPPLQTIEYATNRQLGAELEYGIYYLRPPVCHEIHPSDDNAYGNCASIMFYLRYGINTILFPGDMTPEGMERILWDGQGVEKRYTLFKPSFTRDHPTWHKQTSDQPKLGALAAKRGLSILVAPHHGLESCFPESLYDAINGGMPQLVVISEKRHTRPQDGQIDARYQGKCGASGLNVSIDGQTERRYSVSTANGHHILITFNGTGVPRVFLEKNPAKLFNFIG